MISPAALKSVQPFAIAIAVGFMIGIERERSHPIGQQPLGARTFVLFSLLGAIAGRLNQDWVAFGLTLFVGAVVIAGYLRSSRASPKKPDIGFTTEVAAVLTYGMGYLANLEPFIALLCGVVVLVILLARSKLHTFSRLQLRAEEFQATVILLILAVGIIPFLPDQPLDPWSLIIPQRFGLLVFIIAMLQFAAYLGIRIFGSQKGVLLSGFLSGFVSSTAATAMLSQEAKAGKAPLFATVLAIVLSIVAMYAKLLFIISLVNPHLAWIAGLPSLISAALFGFACWGVSYYLRPSDHFPMPKNPLNLLSALKLALLLGGMIVLVNLVQRFLGESYVPWVVFFSGLFDIHGAALAVAILYNQQHLTLMQVTNDFGMAVLGSFVSKFAIVFTINRHKDFLKYIIPAFTVMLLIYSASWLMLAFFISNNMR